MSWEQEPRLGPGGRLTDEQAIQQANELAAILKEKKMSIPYEEITVKASEYDRVVIYRGGATFGDMSINQAQHLSRLLALRATEAANNIRHRESDAKRKAAEAIPVDRSARTLTDGSPVTPDHRETKLNGQQRDYVVLSDSERAKGFVRPVRRSYVHLACGGATSMGQSIAETYARDPKFYNGTFCCGCGKHFDLIIDGKPQFVWDDGTAVGS
jgi:hypothetical protein